MQDENIPTKQVEVAALHPGRDHWMSGNFGDFLREMTSIYDSIPEEHRAGAEIEVWGATDSDGYGEARIDIGYERPETVIERLERQATERLDIQGQVRMLRDTAERIARQAAEQGMDIASYGMVLDARRLEVSFSTG